MTLHAALLLLAVAGQAAGNTTAQSVDAAAPAATVQATQETDLDRRVRELAVQLRCPVCQSQSILESNAQLALEMRGLIREKLEAGESPEQIKEFFVGSYGEWVLLDPRAQGFNLAVYILPVLLVIAGGVLLVLAARRWMRRPPDDNTPATNLDEDPDLAAW